MKPPLRLRLIERRFRVGSGCSLKWQSVIDRHQHLWAGKRCIAARHRPQAHGQL